MNWWFVALIAYWAGFLGFYFGYRYGKTFGRQQELNRLLQEKSNWQSAFMRRVKQKEKR